MAGHLYPSEPGHKGTDTSAAAAQAAKPTAAYLRTKVLGVLVAHPPGLTADEVAACLDEHILSVRPRVSELHARGLVHDSGLRRLNDSGRTAVVWSVTLKGAA